MRIKKSLQKTTLFAMLMISFIFSGCLKDKFTRTYKIMYPVYADKQEVLASINGGPKQDIQYPGKIFLYGKYIFLNEINRGVHVIDNSNPSNPIPVAFLKIPGNLDIAVKGSILYADLFNDLLAIDISDPLHTSLKKIVPDVFPERWYSNGFAPNREKVVIDWIYKDTTVDISKTGGNIWPQCASCNFMLASDMSGAKSSGAPGISGSMSRFSLVGDYLYAVNQSQLKTVNISDPASPELSTSTPIGWSIETIYPFKNKLFIGSSTGMFIFNIDNATSPALEGTFSHARACDPVIADDSYAYVTLHSGSSCGGPENQLDVIDVANVFSPRLVRTYGMTNPQGLAKDGNILFVCDGIDGLKVYDAKSPGSLSLLHHIKNIETYDAIAWNKNLLLVCKDGLVQIDYSDIKNIRQVSKMVVTRK